MSYGYMQDVPIREDLYRKIVANLGPEPLAGQLVHLVVRKADGTLRYIDVWESKEACDAAFEARIHPAVRTAFGAAGVPPSGEPCREELALIDTYIARLGQPTSRALADVNEHP
jgi:hypothetical protein